MKNIDKNKNRSPPGHRFTEDIYDFSKLIRNISQKLKNSNFEEGLTINKTQNSKAQFFNNENFIIRCLNTVIFTYSVIDDSDFVSLNRIGSHTVENFFYVKACSEINAVNSAFNQINQNFVEIFNEEPDNLLFLNFNNSLKNVTKS